MYSVGIKAPLIPLKTARLAKVTLRAVAPAYRYVKSRKGDKLQNKN